MRYTIYEEPVATGSVVLGRAEVPGSEVRLFVQELRDDLAKPGRPVAGAHLLATFWDVAGAEVASDQVITDMHGDASVTVPSVEWAELAVCAVVRGYGKVVEGCTGPGANAGARVASPMTTSLSGPLDPGHFVVVTHDHHTGKPVRNARVVVAGTTGDGEACGRSGWTDASGRARDLAPDVGGSGAWSEAAVEICHADYNTLVATTLSSTETGSTLTARLLWAHEMHVRSAKPVTVKVVKLRGGLLAEAGPPIEGARVDIIEVGVASVSAATDSNGECVFPGAGIGPVTTVRIGAWREGNGRSWVLDASYDPLVGVRVVLGLEVR